MAVKKTFKKTDSLPDQPGIWVATQGGRNTPVNVYIRDGVLCAHISNIYIPVDVMPVYWSGPYE